MQRQRRLFAGVLIALLALSVMATGVALAHEPDVPPARSTRAAATDDPFMGLADPTAPYDQRFLDEMIMHHQGAVMSARMMIANSSRPELRDLAQRIVTGQQRQLDRMRAWRQQWYPSAGPIPMDMGGNVGGMMGGNAGGMMGGNVGGMMGGNAGGMMGNDGSDRMFLRMMIPHHQLAIAMADDALKNATHDELTGLAREIIINQSAEITEMEGYLQAWYGEASTRDQAGAMRDRMRGMMAGGGCH